MRRVAAIGSPWLALCEPTPDRSMHVSNIQCSSDAPDCANHDDMSELDCDQLAIQWLRAMRGKRSQRAFSRRLGYRTNIAYRWESGRCWPTAQTVMRAMKKLGWDLSDA